MTNQVNIDSANDFIENEIDFRMSLIEDPKFIFSAIEIAKKLGITAVEWNKNKAWFLMYFANQVVGIDNRNGNKLREKFQTA